MMENLLALAAASALLVTIPGPNLGLIIANSLEHGLRAGLVTVLGTTLGILIQLVIVVVGLSALIETAASVFAWLRGRALPICCGSDSRPGVRPSRQLTPRRTD